MKIRHHVGVPRQIKTRKEIRAPPERITAVRNLYDNEANESVITSKRTEKEKK